MADLEQSQRKILNRLKRAQGQLGGVISAIEQGDGCKDVLTQLRAVTTALDRAGFLIVSCAMQYSLEGDQSDGEGTGFLEGEHLSPEELEKLFLMLS